MRETGKKFKNLSCKRFALMISDKGIKTCKEIVRLRRNEIDCL